MPYIKVDDRFRVVSTLQPQTAGELNYLITKLCYEYVQRCEKNYRVLNEVIGVLEAAKLEFYRRTVAPYEDVKIKENGDLSFFEIG